MDEMDDQEEKEILIQHSEKLALAYDFLKVVPKKPTRIIKNLRICEDCHMAFKLVSLARNSEML